MLAHLIYYHLEHRCKLVYRVQATLAPFTPFDPLFPFNAILTIMFYCYTHVKLSFYPLLYYYTAKQGGICHEST